LSQKIARKLLSDVFSADTMAARDGVNFPAYFALPTCAAKENLDDAPLP
jgi:hypothetical protein